MVTLLIGHRGSGKTALLERLRRYAEDRRRPLQCLDLDAEIAAGERAPIGECFTRAGEAGFRDLERSYLARLLANAPSARGDTWIAVGAGFEGPVPPGVRSLWVRRESDADGRIFLDRPRLDPALDPLDEFRRRFRAREARYAEWADDVLTVPEGFDRPGTWEAAALFGELTRVGGTLTLLPEHFRADAAPVKAWLRRGVERLELRDDLLTLAALEAGLAMIPATRVLYSFRRPHPPFVPPKLDDISWDWPLELGACPHGAPPIVSLHERKDGESVTAAAARLDAAPAASSAVRKLAVVIESFQELMEGHAWQQASPRRRAFLPRSADGRWAWYRNHFRGPVAFFREAGGSAADQPLLLDWVRVRSGAAHFAAVLGDPVRHSRTPAEHESFFAPRSVPVYAVRVTREEWAAGALDRLRELGLRFAAVTSPLKEGAFEAAAARSAEAERLRVVNTLQWREERGWAGDATDAAGLRALVEAARPEGPVVVWGGGALLATLRDALPDASFYAARTGEPRSGFVAVEAPKTVLWAGSAPRVQPPAAWLPRLVIDLGYREDSPARRYALRTGARYVDGTAMFVAQAGEQRKFWSGR